MKSSLRLLDFAFLGSFLGGSNVIRCVLPTKVSVLRKVVAGYKKILSLAN